MFRSLLAAFSLAVVLSPAGAGHAAAGVVATTPSGSVSVSAPMDLTSQITDAADVLGDTSTLTVELDELRREWGLQLFVVFVESFDGLGGEEWAARTYSASGMGGQDVLLAVAVEDRRYGTYATDESGLTRADDQQVRSGFIEPALGAEDWDGAVSAAAKGYGEALNGGGSGGLGVGWLAVPLLLPVLFLLLPLIVGALFMRSWRRRSRGGGAGDQRAPQSGRTALPLEELRSRAASSLVEMDDAIRSSAEELEFAEAQFGRQATQRFRQALDAAQQRAAEAFRLQREVGEDVSNRLAGEGARWHYQQVIALAGQVDQQLDAEAAEFERLRGLEANVPQFLEDLAGRVQEVRRRVPVAEQELAGLAASYPVAVLQSVGGAVEQAKRLLDSADELVRSGRSHLDRAGTPADVDAPASLLPDGENRAAAVAAARAAEDAIGQADGLLASVSRAREELSTAVERLGPALASLQSDIDDAARLQADDPVTTAALVVAGEAVATGNAARNDGDPLAALRTLAKAEHDVDNALARYRADDEQQQRARGLLDRRFNEVVSLLRQVDQTLTRNRGAVGSEARTLLSEAVRTYNEARNLADSDPQAAAESLHASERLAEDAYASAQDDLDSWHHSDYSGGHASAGGSLAPMILGGILAGGLASSLGRGGGWGGSRGGWGGGFGGGGAFGGGGGFGGGGRF